MSWSRTSTSCSLYIISCVVVTVRWHRSFVHVRKQINGNKQTIWRTREYKSMRFHGNASEQPPSAWISSWLSSFWRISWLGLIRIKIKTVQPQGLTPPRLQPGKAREPGPEEGGDRGNDLVAKLERALGAALPGATWVSLWDNSSRLTSNTWDTPSPTSEARPLATASQRLPPRSCQEICDDSLYWSSLSILSTVKIYRRHIK